MTISNEVKLIGTLKESAYEGHTKFYYLEIPRLSGTVDTVRVKFYKEFNAEEYVGQHVELVNAHIRSRTDKESKKLYIYVTAESCLSTEEKSTNKIVIDAAVVKLPTYRKTPLGRTILDLLIVNNYRMANYIPSLMWDKLADKYKELKVADELKLTGMLQSRVYTNSKQETHTAYEFSISKVESVEEKDNGDIS